MIHAVASQIRVRNGAYALALWPIRDHMPLLRVVCSGNRRNVLVPYSNAHWEDDGWGRFTDLPGMAEFPKTTVFLPRLALLQSKTRLDCAARLFAASRSSYFCFAFEAGDPIDLQSKIFLFDQPYGAEDSDLLKSTAGASFHLANNSFITIESADLRLIRKAHDLVVNSICRSGRSLLSRLFNRLLSAEGRPQVLLGTESQLFSRWSTEEDFMDQRVQDLVMRGESDWKFEYVRRPIIYID